MHIRSNRLLLPKETDEPDHSYLLEKKRNSERRLSMLTRSGEALNPLLWQEMQRRISLQGLPESLPLAPQGPAFRIPTAPIQRNGVPAPSLEGEAAGHQVRQSPPSLPSHNTIHTVGEDATEGNTQPIPSLKDIMAEQERQRQTAQPSNSPQVPQGPQPRSYAAATGVKPVANTTHVTKETLSDEEVRSRVPSILNMIPKPMERAEPSMILKYKLSKVAAEKFGRKTIDLEERAVILFTDGLNPLKDTVVKWAQEHIITKMKLNILQLRVLDRSHYLLTMESTEDRMKLLSAGPQYLNGRFVEIIPWTPDYDTATLTKKRKPAWVSIAGLCPSLEEGTKILSQLGKVLHMTGVDQHGKSKFADVRGLVLLSIEDIHPSAIEVEYEEGSAEFQLLYEYLPEGCFTCHEVGHVARFCPLTTKTRTVSQDELDEAVRAAAESKLAQENEENDIEGEQPKMGQGGGKPNKVVSEHKARGAPVNPSIPISNPFELLEESEEETTSETEGEEDEEIMETVQIASQLEHKESQKCPDLNSATGETQQSNHEVGTGILPTMSLDTNDNDMEISTAQKGGPKAMPHYKKG
ncbi:hypothetical protein R1sor_022239 [Riccia sorocarpa]|uniref:CCHC-type domain-containing protein n=1 Tax=Riccia sorocarpa TaxID=122646 RepID=A0ABD3GK08_9MARC